MIVLLLCLAGWFVLSVVVGLALGPCIGGGEPAVFVAACHLPVFPTTQGIAGHTAALFTDSVGPRPTAASFRSLR